MGFASTPKQIERRAPGEDLRDAECRDDDASIGNYLTSGFYGRRQSAGLSGAYQWAVARRRCYAADRSNRRSFPRRQSRFRCASAPDLPSTFASSSSAQHASASDTAGPAAASSSRRARWGMLVEQMPVSGRIRRTSSAAACRPLDARRSNVPARIRSPSETSARGHSS